MDFLFVRGINYFVPHAFDSFFPDPEFPPHFGAEGNDPSFDGFGALMRYSNKMSHLLYGTTHVAKIALMYDEELHWSSKNARAMQMHTVAKELYDAHFDYDIIPYDYFDPDKVIDGKLCLGDEKFECLIVPYADHVSAKVGNALKALSERGLSIYFIDGIPKNLDIEAKAVRLCDLTREMRMLGLEDVIVEEGFEKLRIYHSIKDGNDVFMFVNEDVVPINTTVKLPVSGKCIRLDVANGLTYKDICNDGELTLKLQPSQSVIIAFSDFAEACALPEFDSEITIPCSYELELASYDDMNKFTSCGRFTEYFNVTGPEFKPSFSGKMRYTFNCQLKSGRNAIIDFGDVGQNISLTVNGKQLGTRFAPPYLFDISEALTDGENVIVATVGNTLVHKMRDKLSRNMMIAPSGLLSDIKVRYYK